MNAMANNQVTFPNAVELGRPEELPPPPPIPRPPPSERCSSTIPINPSAKIK